MNRRELFKRLAVGAAAVTTVRASSTTSHAAADVEPVPSRWDFEEPLWTPMDVSVTSVQAALDRIGWESGLTPKALLCVHPAQYAMALNIAAAFGGVLQVWASREISRELHRFPSTSDSDVNPLNDRDAWFIAWRGRRVGSAGA